MPAIMKLNPLHLFDYTFVECKRCGKNVDFLFEEALLNSGKNRDCCFNYNIEVELSNMRSLIQNYTFCLSEEEYIIREVIL